MTLSRLPRESSLKIVIVAVVLLPLLLGIWARFIEPYWIELRRVRIPIQDLPLRFEGFRIAVLSDFHFPRYSGPWLVRRAIRYANSVDPDIVLLAGDLFDRSSNDPKTIPDLGELFAGISHRYGIYAVLGNHDHWVGAEKAREALESETPICLIENRSVLLGEGEEVLALAGVGDKWMGVVDWDAALSGIPESVPRLLLSHNPDVAQEAPPVRVDLQISGHTHGGQVRIPFGPAPKIPSWYGNKYRAGLVWGPNHRVYINRGIASMKRIRFWSRPEVTCITLFREAAS